LLQGMTPSMEEQGQGPAIEVLHLKTFDCSPKKAVDDVSFGVSQDTIFAMLGPNGTGGFHSVIGCCSQGYTFRQDIHF